MTESSSENYNQKPSEETLKLQRKSSILNNTQTRKNAMKKNEVLKKLAVKTVIALFSSFMIVSNISPEVCNAVSNPETNHTYTRIGRRTLNGKRRIGDADNDGYITVHDSDYIHDWCLGKDTGIYTLFWGSIYTDFTKYCLYDYYSPVSVEFMDIDGNGKVTCADAALLMRYVFDKHNYAYERGEDVPGYWEDYCIPL